MARVRIEIRERDGTTPHVGTIPAFHKGFYDRVPRGKAEATIAEVPAKLEWHYEYVASILVSPDDARKLPGFEPIWDLVRAGRQSVKIAVRESSRMYRRIVMAEDGTKLRQSIESGRPPAIADVVGLKVRRRRVTGTVTKVEPLTEQKLTHLVEIVVKQKRPG